MKVYPCCWQCLRWALSDGGCVTMKVQLQNVTSGLGIAMLSVNLIEGVFIWMLLRGTPRSRHVRSIKIVMVETDTKVLVIWSRQSNLIQICFKCNLIISIFILSIMVLFLWTMQLKVYILNNWRIISYIYIYIYSYNGMFPIYCIN